MPVWLETALGLAAVALCAVACWREDRLIAWEARVAQRFKQKRRWSCEKISVGRADH